MDTLIVSDGSTDQTNDILNKFLDPAYAQSFCRSLVARRRHSIARSKLLTETLLSLWMLGSA